MAKAFDRIIEKDPSTVMIVDGLNLAFRYMHAKSIDFVDDYINVVKSLQNSYKCGTVIILSDIGSSSYRKELYPEYKGNRAEKYANQTEKEAEEFAAFFKEFERTMEAIALEFPVIRYKGVEADDLAAYIVKKLPLLVPDPSVWLISSDKDWDLLISSYVSRFSYVTRKETTLENWNNHYDCTPEEYISIKCLNGDSGDNIAGVKGIGPKRALELVREYGSAMDIYANLPINSKYKYIQSLNESGETIILNYKLMDLRTFCADAIGVDNREDIDSRLLEIFNNV